MCLPGLGQIAAAGSLLGIGTRNTTFVIATLPDTRVSYTALVVAIVLVLANIVVATWVL